MSKKKVTGKELLYGDFDGDHTPNVDDSFPFDKTKNEQVEELRLTNELKEIRKHALGFKDETQQVVKYFKKRGFHTKSRIKSTYSIINKLRRKQIHKVWDIGGVMILTKTAKEAINVGKLIRRKYKVLSEDDYFSSPKDKFYRALHFVVEIRELPVEIQVKTEKEYKIHLKAHTLYKEGKLTPEIEQNFLEEAMT